jgi:uncharacterized RDD family membrane protein YckC
VNLQASSQLQPAGPLPVTPQSSPAPAAPQGYAAAPQGGYAAAPQGGYAAAPQGGYAAAPQGGYAAAPQGGYAAAPQYGYAPQPQYGYPPAPTGPAYAEFLVRFFAFLIDEFLAVAGAGLTYGCFVMLAAMVGGITGGGEGGLAGLIIGFFFGGTAALLAYITYFVKLETGPKQGTFGKQMLGVKICNAQGGRISVLQSLGRLIVKNTFSLLFFAIGYLMAAFTEKKQALHDFVASTYVVKA